MLLLLTLNPSFGDVTLVIKFSMNRVPNHRFSNDQDLFDDNEL